MKKPAFPNAETLKIVHGTRLTTSSTFASYSRLALMFPRTNVLTVSQVRVIAVSINVDSLDPVRYMYTFLQSQH